MWCNIDFGSGFSVVVVFFVCLFVLFCFCFFFLFFFFVCLFFFFFVLLIFHCSEDRLTWMEGLVRGFTAFSTVFQSYRDDGRVNMKGSVQ